MWEPGSGGHNCKIDDDFPKANPENSKQKMAKELNAREITNICNAVKKLGAFSY